MIVWSFNLLLLAFGILIVGMIKPRWLLFWMDKPGRLPIIIFSSALFMVAAVMFGEGNRDKQNKNALQTEQIKDTIPNIPVETVKE